jgi:hypothetical protein
MIQIQTYQIQAYEVQGESTEVEENCREEKRLKRSGAPPGRS